MSVLLHISDTHFGTEQPQVVEALVALAARQRPDLVVLSGDITQRARPAQFLAARAFVDRLGASVLAIPGNHDIALFDLWSRLTRPYARYGAVFGHELEPVHSSRDLLVIGVNTTRAWRHKDGEVSAAQIDRVASQLKAASPAQLRVVAVHQPAAVTLALDRAHLKREMPASSSGGTSCIRSETLCPSRSPRCSRTAADRSARLKARATPRSGLVIIWSTLKAIPMRSYPHNSPEAAARIVALVLISDGHVCSTEFDILKQLGAESELGLEPQLLPHIVHSLCEELLASGYESGSLMANVDDATLASLMAEISDPALQRTVLRLSFAAARADGHLADGEAMVVAAARNHWRLVDGEELMASISTRRHPA